MDKQTNAKSNKFRRGRLAITVVALIAVALVILPIIDAFVTPLRWQKHKWMLTETFGTGITSSSIFKMNLDEMDKWLQGRGLKRAFELEDYPDTTRIWKAEGIDLYYSTGHLHNFIISDEEHPSDWQLDSGLRMSQTNNDVREAYGVPDKEYYRSFYYVYVPDSSRYVKAMFIFDEQGSLTSMGYVFRQRSYWDRVYLRPSTR
jgi:hypothetical protein